MSATSAMKTNSVHRKLFAVSTINSFFVSLFILQDSRSVAGTEDKETFLVTLTKPCLYVQQVAFDKGEST